MRERGASEGIGPKKQKNSNRGWEEIGKGSSAWLKNKGKECYAF